ncbi:uncharacterized protein PGTG_16243 [Puccinia graminis f. sp. tritici CRL 75-36-700-3]|uniref:DNA 3'-5' helicase n=1 Tax=Puccinia graminis f. sp. tritici (strain CRL 75-36-700-3 / race SCCL) TaxID=418459 RepID=E3L068_PUCGT|nr:uncharacterized protein PGTG_16243 [Puccinia graminis f. sp. tritici CRL 75-36-700-3]EFP89955.1 hypothetical protein PGTG_16243 [Puccinia graminis f. sp. tritici CRL 75-36-700-3]
MSLHQAMPRYWKIVIADFQYRGKHPAEVHAPDSQVLQDSRELHPDSATKHNRPESQTRSQLSMNRVSKHKPPPCSPPQAAWASVGITVLKKIAEKNDQSLRNEISTLSLKHYNQEAKPRQIDAVFNLVRGRNTFLLAGTGFGKSRIPELYFRTLPIKEKAVILVLNPLDSLGDNQVLEKTRSGFTAINLTKLTICPEECEKIADGDYNFVYLSPEIFLNSKLWDRIYFSDKFQQRLGLVVVDEAHMVYEPSYGNLGGHLMTRNNMPILLMSATCRPVAIKAIRKSLKLPEETLWMLRGELTRPEIRFIRVTMDWSMW